MKPLTKIMLGIAGLIILTLILLNFSKPPSETVYPLTSTYSDEPKDWIKTSNGSETISINEATKDLGAYFGGDMHYVDTLGKEYVMTINGHDQSEWFNRASLSKNDSIRFKIGNSMTPNDGIPEAFSIARMENGSFVVYLFLDQDWKEKSNGNIYLIWGSNLNDSKTLSTKSFDFSNKKNGIYIDSISQNISWLADSEKKGGIIFGEISLEEFKQKKLDKIYLFLR